MSWETLTIGGGIGAALAATVYALVVVTRALGTVRAAQGEVTAAKAETGVQLRLRHEAESQRDAALADVARLEADKAAAIAREGALMERVNELEGEHQQEVKDAIADGSLADADRQLDNLLR